MASGDLKTSTPLQCRYDSGYGSYRKTYNMCYDKTIELSPIRKQPSLKSNFLKVCSILNTEAVKKWNQTVDKVSKKLMFAPHEDTPSSIHDLTDSGIVYDSVSSENETASQKLTDFTDENCNILFSCDKTDKLDHPYKYICGEVEKQLGKELKSCNQDKSSYLYKFLGDEAIINMTADNTQKTAIKLDLLHELHVRNCTGILSCILSYLSEEELRITSYVSKQWQNIVFDDKNANTRRITYINNKKNIAMGSNKENRFQAPSSAQRHHKTAFVSIINDKAETLPTLSFDDLSGKFDSFIEEAKLIEDKEGLKKCPKCLYPAKAETEDKFCCTRKLCQHEFCKKCSGPYLDNHLCPVPELNNNLSKIIVGSKKSKKNLRRL